MKAVDPRNKKEEEEEEEEKEEEEEEEEDGEMGIFYNSSKIMKLVLFILIIDGTSKQHKRMAQKVLNRSLKGLDGFKAYFACVLLGILTKFSVNPYYKPLSRFMIYMYIYIYIYIYICQICQIHQYFPCQNFVPYSSWVMKSNLLHSFHTLSMQLQGIFTDSEDSTGGYHWCQATVDIQVLLLMLNYVLMVENE